MTKVKVENPGPAALWVINGGKRMRKRGRKKTTRRSPARHHTSRRRAAYARSATPTPNPRRRQHARRATARRAPVRRLRRRNPHGASLFAKGLALAAGAALVQFAVSFVPPIGGVSAIADAARTAGVGWLIGTAMHKTGFLKQYADDVTLAGFTLAGGKVISSFILPFANRLFTRPTPPPSAQEAAQMAGMAAFYPGLNPYGLYAGRRGVNGLATWYPGQQIINDYAGAGIPIA